MSEKELFFKQFNDGLHRLGRIMLLLAVILLLSVNWISNKVSNTSLF